MDRDNQMLSLVSVVFAGRWSVLVVNSVVPLLFLLIIFRQVSGSKNGISNNDKDNKQTADQDSMVKAPPVTPVISINPVDRISEGIRSTEEVLFMAMLEPNWNILKKLQRDYREEYQAELEKLSTSMEMALLLEEENLTRKVRLSGQIQERIVRTSALYEEQEEVLKLILQPFPVVMCLPSIEDFSTSNNQQRQEVILEKNSGREVLKSSIIRSRTGSAFQNALTFEFSARDSEKSAPASYDSALQVFAHMVRDWSEWGAPVRESLYAWCRQAIQDHCQNTPDTDKLTILIPGAGLGRLAWELAELDGHVVQALEVSLAMAAAASFVFRQQKHVKIYPYIHDAFQNQVHSDDRYLGVTVPDVSVSSSEGRRGGSLSFVVAPFEILPGLPQIQSSFDAIVTCFFIDTATNLYQYLDIINMVLKPRAVWINVGPLQWHTNSLLPGLAANELRQILEQDFQILHWSVDNKPMEYRNPTTSIKNDRRLSTAYNGYCPLRFVLRKKPNTAS